MAPLSKAEVDALTGEIPLVVPVGVLLVTDGLAGRRQCFFQSHIPVKKHLQYC